MRLIILLVLASVTVCAGQVQRLSPDMVHLRNGEPREWSDFTSEAKRELSLTFETTNAQWATLRVRQRDVRQDWTVQINGSKIGSLVPDEKDLIHLLSIPPGKLLKGKNTLRITTTSSSPDDIVVGEISLYQKTAPDLMKSSTVVRVEGICTSSAYPVRFP